MNLSCHCGNVKISVDKDPETFTDCNCSLCRRYGSLWGYYDSDNVIINYEAESLGTYSWGDKNIDFKHCNKCGCVTHYLTTEKINDDLIGINFRMADPKEIESITIRKFDGANTWRFID